MKQRIITGTVLCLILIPLLMVKELFPLFQVTMLVLAVIASTEMIRLYEQQKKFPLGVKIIIIIFQKFFCLFFCIYFKFYIFIFSSFLLTIRLTSETLTISTRVSLGIISLSFSALAVQSCPPTRAYPIESLLLISTMTLAVCPIRLSTLVFSPPTLRNFVRNGLVKISSTIDTTKNATICAHTGNSTRAITNATSAPPANHIVVRLVVISSKTINSTSSPSQIHTIKSIVPPPVRNYS